MSQNRQRMSPSGRPMLGALVTWSAGAVPAQNTTSQNFSVPGAEQGDCPIVANAPTATGLMFAAQEVVIDGTVTIICQNATVNPLDPDGTALVIRVL